MKRKIRQAICAMLLFAFVGAIGNPGVIGNYSVLAKETASYDTIDGQLKREREELHIPGMAVVIVDAKEVLFAGTYGDCSSIDTPFLIGSVSKSFTALAIMQLVEEGKIDLDEPGWSAYPCGWFGISSGTCALFC